MQIAADDSDWVLYPHTERKHRVLSYYLGIWSKILGERFANLVYWDCYAGRGDYSEGEPGSPLLAMEISQRCFEEGNSKDRPINMMCIFIEKNRACHDYLRDLLHDLYPDEEGIRWHLYGGDCARTYYKLQTESDNPMFTKQYPNFFFLDPYGLMAPLEMVKHMMLGRSREVMITFMVEFVKRYASQRSQERNLKGIFGADTLTNLQRLCSEPDAHRAIADYYSRRLHAEEGAGIRFLTQPFEMRPDRRDIPLYYLIGGTNHRLGLQKMHESMRAVSDNEDFSYQGKFEGQRTLSFFFDDKITEIAQWIIENVDFEVGTFEMIYTKCCLHTTWARPDVRKAILKLEDEGKVFVTLKPGRIRIGRTLSSHFIQFQRESIVQERTSTNSP